MKPLRTILIGIMTVGLLVCGLGWLNAERRLAEAEAGWRSKEAFLSEELKKWQEGYRAYRTVWEARRSGPERLWPRSNGDPHLEEMRRGNDIAEDNLELERQKERSRQAEELRRRIYGR